MAVLTSFQDLKPKHIVSFTTYGNNIIPNVVDAIVLAIESGASLRDPTQAAANAANLYPAIPIIPGTVLSKDFTSYDYLLLQLQDGSVIEVAEPWINPVSLQRQVMQNAIILVPDFDESKIKSVITLLAANGLPNATITVSPV